MNTRAGVLFLSLVLGGCATFSAAGPIAGPGGDADYRHPTTGDVQHCDNHTADGFEQRGVIGLVTSANRYADCKTDLEDKGYVRVRGTTRPAAATPTPLVVGSRSPRAGQTNDWPERANPQVDLSQGWILGTWGTFEGHSGSVDGQGQFEFRREGMAFKWRMVRTGWFAGVQTTQTASGSVRRLSSSTVELTGKYESSNLGSIVGTAVHHVLARDGDSLRGHETFGDGAPSLISLERMK